MILLQPRKQGLFQQKIDSSELVQKLNIKSRQINKAIQTKQHTQIKISMSLSNSSLVESHIYKRFTLIKKVGSGAYGHVWKVEEKSTKKIFALKKIFDAFQHATDAQRTYREIEILKQTNHNNIVKLHETLKANNGKDVYLLFQYMESDLHNVIASDILKDIHVRFIIYQVARALKYLHSGSVIHRDLKPSNVLVNSDCVIKLCDFGLVRSIAAKEDAEPVLTEGVATRWYRAPQVLLGSRAYSTPADVWSFGCIIYEILAKRPLFPGNSTMDQIQKLCQLTGYPSEQQIESLNSESAQIMLSQVKLPTSHKSSLGSFQKFPPQLRDLLSRMIVFSPKKRMTIDQILQHECVQMFYKPQDEVLCQKQFVLKVDDNKKLTVEEYRQMIYTQASNSVTRMRHDLSDVVGKSNSVKVIRRTVVLNQTSNTSVKQSKTLSSIKKQVPKNRSFHTFKAVTPIKNESSVSFMTNHKTEQGQTFSKQEQKGGVKFFHQKELKQRFRGPPNMKNEVKWSPKFLVRKSPLNQQQQYTPKKITNESSVQPSFIKGSVNLQTSESNDSPTKNTSLLTEVKKHNRQLNSPTNFVSSKFWMPTTSKNVVKRQIPTRGINFNDNNPSFKSPIKKEISGMNTSSKSKMGEERKFSSFGKFSSQLQDKNFSSQMKQDQKVVTNKSNQKSINPEKNFKSYQKFPAAFSVWNSPKASNLKKETNNSVMKSKPSYFNSQKYIKPVTTIVANPQMTQLTKSEVQKAE